LLGALLCLATLAIAPAAGQAGDVSVIIGWHPVSVGWNPLSVSADGRTVEVTYRRWGCEGLRNVRAAVRESGSGVLIVLRGESPEWSAGPGPVRPMSCPPPYRVPLAVSLVRPLAGRGLHGYQTGRPFETRVGVVRVPRLVGFAPHDAVRALGFAFLRGRAEVVLPTRGRRRAVAQSPAAGRRVPVDTIVTVRVTGG
jgi:hypothetical protein